ncbi:MAG: neutral/alkaline non-lysosomal ceramidase N-terminal domain-containing protein [Gemmatimonadota bacterium]
MPLTSLPAPRGRCRLGVAQVDITPPPDAYHRNWGAALHDRAAGIHRPLTASALAVAPLAAGTPAVVLVALDLGWLRTREMADLLAAVRRGVGAAAGDVVLTFSHTHAAIGLDLEREGEPGGEHIRPYLEALPDLVADACRRAAAALVPAEVSFGRGRCDLAMNRDCRDEERGIYVCGPNPQGVADDAVLVARATALDDGRPLLALVNYACHATTLAWENKLISPDYVGALREVVAAETDSPCVFLQGAAGDLGPRYGFVGDPAVADANGRQLGFAALAALASLPPPGLELRYQGPLVSGATLGVWRHAPVDPAGLDRFRTRELVVDLPLRPLPSAAELARLEDEWRSREEEARRRGDEEEVRTCRAQVERARRAGRRREELSPSGLAEYRVRLWQVGQGVFVLVGGEPYSLLQRELRARFPDTPLVVAELCNHSYSYILPRDQYGKGLYQDDCATLAPGSLEAIIEAVAAQLAAWGCADPAARRPDHRAALRPQRS